MTFSQLLAENLNPPTPASSGSSNAPSPETGSNRRRLKSITSSLAARYAALQTYLDSLNGYSAKLMDSASSVKPLTS
jgi:hypothetical protein